MESRKNYFALVDAKVSRFSLSRPIGASIVALSFLNTPFNKAIYSLFILLFLKSSLSISWALLVLATKSKPLVSLSIR